MPAPTELPLTHRRFLVTRPAAQAEHLAGLIRAAGGQAIILPMIEIAATEAPAALDSALARLEEFDFAVFVSTNAIAEVGRKLPDVWPANVVAAVVGPASAEAARELGIGGVIEPTERFDSEGLLARPELADMKNKKVVVFRGNGGRELIVEELSARGAIVEVVEAYRRLPPKVTAAELEAALSDGCDGIIVTSSESVRNLYQISNDHTRPQLCAALTFAPHSKVADTARDCGAGRVVLTAAGDAGIVATLEEFFAAPDIETAVSGPDLPPVTLPAPALSIDKVSNTDTSATDSPHSYAPPPPRFDKPADEAKAQPTADKLSRRRVQLPLYVAAGAVVLSAGLSVWHHRNQTDLRLETGTQLNQVRKSIADGQATAGMHENRERALEARIAALESRLAESQSQQVALEAMYRDLTGDREDAVLADAEQTLQLANQQLQLAGNVSLALTALYGLDERLQGFGKPNFIALRKALAHDIDALRRLPYVDTVGLAAKIDTLAGTIDALPLQIDLRSDGGEPPSSIAADASFWQRLKADVARELHQIIKIRHMDKPDAMLMTPEQNFSLRQHVKLRLLNARVALLQRDETSYQADIKAAERYLKQFFDGRAQSTQATLAGIKTLRETKLVVEYPNLADSLAAVRDSRPKSGGNQ